MFNETVITKKGIALNNKVQAGSVTIEYLRVGLGKGIYQKNDKLEDQEQLKEEKQSVPISSIKIIDENTVKLRVVINNEGITEGYDITEIGLYAMDPDEGEILYSVANATEGKVDYQPSKTEVVDYQITIDLYSTVSNSNNVTIKLDTGAVALAADLIQLKEDMSKGDISETVIETLDTVEDKYPIPAAGESVKRFFGKVLTFLRNIRPLTGDINIYVSTTGSDITGDGGESNPYASIGKALGTITKDLGGYTAAINISDGTYNEDVVIKGISNGYIRLQRNGVQELNNLCNVKSIRVENCNSVSISGLNLTTTDTSGIFGTRTDFINVSSCQSVSNAGTQVSFNFDYVSVVRVSGNRSLNHNICLRAYASDVYSEHWSSDSIGFYGIFSEGSARISKGNIFQPKGMIHDENVQSGSIISSRFGAKVGSLSYDVNIYVAPAGSDTTGDGTSGNPFKTIQYAIDSLPKDFGGYFATLNISPGTYVEDIIVSGFTGTLQFTLLGNVTTGSITIGNARLLCTASAIYTLTIRYLNVVATGRFDSFSSVAITTTDYVAGQPGIGNKSSIVANRGDIYISGPITLTGNTDIGISASAISRIYFSTVSGTGFNIGAIVGTGSVITCGTANGMSVSAITPILQNGAGVFTYASGTQISGPISTGLACTWGTISGGYIRHGNPTGAAMITISLGIVTTTALTSGVEYVINGFPTAVIGPCVTAGPQNIVSNCYLYGATGQMRFKPSQNLVTNYILSFTCTYLTNP